MIRGDFHLFFVFLLFNVVERQYKRNGKDMDENNVPDMRPTYLFRFFCIDVLQR